MKLSRIAAIVLIGIVTIFVVACGSSGTPTTGFTTYTDTINGFSVSVPDGWELASDETGIYLLGPSTCGGGHYYSSVSAASAEGYMSGHTFYAGVLEPYLQALDNYELVSKETVTIDGIQTIKAIYTYVDTYGYPVQQMAYVLVNQQTAWVIGGTCATTCWNTYQGTFNTIANSFNLLY